MRARSLNGALFWLLSLAVVSFGLAKRNDPFIFLNEEEVLQLEFHYSADLKVRFSSPLLADQIEEDGRDEFVEAWASVLELSGFPVAVEVLDPLDRHEKGLPLLIVNAVRWGSDGMGSMELALSVSLESGDYRNKVGFYRANDSALALTSSDRIRAVRVKLMKEALGKMVFDLDRHFKLPGEE